MTFPSSTKKTFSMARIFWQKDFPRSRDLFTHSLLLCSLQYKKQRVIIPWKNRILRGFFLSSDTVLYYLDFGPVSYVVNPASLSSFFPQNKIFFLHILHLYHGLIFGFVWCFCYCLGFFLLFFWIGFVVCTMLNSHRTNMKKRKGKKIKRNKWCVAILPVRSGMEIWNQRITAWLVRLMATTSSGIVINLCHIQTTGGSRTLCWHKFQGSFLRFLWLLSFYARTFIFSR